MAANIQITCPVDYCDYTAGLRFDPGPENDHPIYAKAELMKEHPHHNHDDGWKFLRDRYPGIYK